MKAPCLCDRRTDIRCDESHCDIAGPGEPHNPNQCRVCWLRLAKNSHPRLHATRCLHLGKPTGEVRACHTCGGGNSIPLYACAVHGICTATKHLVVKEDGFTRSYPWCRTCKDHVPAPVEANDWQISGLRHYHAFNGSICAWRGRTYLAFRRNWDSARLHIAEMSDDLRRIVGFSKELRLGLLDQDRGAQEDPRLWVYRDRLHISYTGVNWGLSQPVSVCHARLNEDLDVDASMYAHYPDRTDWEKNWGFFEYEDELYILYQIHPLKILHMRHGTPILLHADASTAEKIPYHGRGGAPPVLHNGEWYCFFHYLLRPYEYAVGLLTLEGQPPFRLKRWTRELLLEPNPDEYPGGDVARVVFPGGAIFRDGTWFVTYGYYDREIRIRRWDEKYIEGILKKP